MHVICTQMAQMLAVNVAEWKMHVRIFWGEWREESSFGNDEIGEWGGGEAAPLCSKASDVVMTSALSSFPQLIRDHQNHEAWSVNFDPKDQM